jgi:hypothetical protein
MYYRLSYMPEQYGLNVIQELKERYMPLVFQIILPAWKHASQQRLWEPVF